MTAIPRPWLHRFTELVQLTVLETFQQADTCVLSTRLGLAVMDKAGVRAKAQPVWVAAYTAQAFKLAQQGIPVAQWPDEAWTVGIVDRGDHTYPDGTWGGHLVVLVRPPGQPRTLIDLAAGQLDRPANGLRVPGPVLMNINAGERWTPQDPQRTLIEHHDGEPTVMEYWLMPPAHPTASSYLTSPDWTARGEVIAELADGIYRQLGDPGTA